MSDGQPEVASAIVRARQSCLTALSGENELSFYRNAYPLARAITVVAMIRKRKQLWMEETHERTNRQPRNGFPEVKIRAAPPRVATKPQRIAPTAKVRAAIYGTPLHRAWSAAVIARSGGMCQGVGCPNPNSGGRLFADHVRELRDGGGFELSNGVALCGSCHTRKTLAARARRVAS